MVKVYMWRCNYHPDMEKLRELLRKVTHMQKLNILQQTKDGWDRTALHEAAYRDDAEMITTILSSLQSSDRLRLVVMKNGDDSTPLHEAASKGHRESVDAILNLLSEGQLKQLLTEEGINGKTALGVSSMSGKTHILVFRSLSIILAPEKFKSIQSL